MAEHFHAPTRQWTGPNARSYTWLTTDGTLSFLRNALDNGETLISDEAYQYNVDWAYIDMHCPDKYREAFTVCTPVSYTHLYGVQIAFRDYKMNLGILGSPWVGLSLIHISSCTRISRRFCRTCARQMMRRWWRTWGKK